MQDCLRIKVIVAEKHKLIKEALIKLLESLPSISVIDEAEDGYELISKCKKNPPDISIVGSDLTDPESFTAVEEIHGNNKNIRFLILTDFENDLLCKNNIRDICNGIINKNICSNELFYAIHSVVLGNFYLNHQLQQIPAIEIKSKLTKNKADLLSKSENRVLYEMSKGLSKHGVSNELFLSVRTIESHCYKIKQKLGLGTTAQLIHFAHEVFQNNGNGKK